MGTNRTYVLYCTHVKAKDFSECHCCPVHSVYQWVICPFRNVMILAIREASYTIGFAELEITQLHIDFLLKFHNRYFAGWPTVWGCHILSCSPNTRHSCKPHTVEMFDEMCINNFMKSMCSIWVWQVCRCVLLSTVEVPHGVVTGRLVHASTAKQLVHCDQGARGSWGCSPLACWR